MTRFEPRTAEEHFALQRTTKAAEHARAVADARIKGAELNRATNQDFYHNLALFSGGTIALSVTFLGYLKTLLQPIHHLDWLRASWCSLMTCTACSLFWPFVNGYYSHYARAREYAEAIKEKNEVEASEISHLTRNVVNLQTPEQLEEFRKPRLEVADASDKNAKYLRKREEFYLHLWRWLGRVAHASFLLGLGLLLAFAIRNM